MRQRMVAVVGHVEHLEQLRACLVRVAVNACFVLSSIDVDLRSGFYWFEQQHRHTKIQ
jgi:hypothetical protein